jgi:hypothetical protein
MAALKAQGARLVKVNKRKATMNGEHEPFQGTNIAL